MVSEIPIKHVDKGWGYEKWIVNKSEYCGKLLFFNKGKRCSWHFHKLKDEVFYLQSGKMLVKYSDQSDIEKAEELILNPGENYQNIENPFLIIIGPLPFGILKFSILFFI